MLIDVNPKLPMRNKNKTREFYIDMLGFQELGNHDFEGYLMVQRDNIQIHFFQYNDLDPELNYGQVYIRVNDLETEYKSMLNGNVTIHPNGQLDIKPWGQKEFSILDPDNNLLTFGQPIV